MTSLYLHTLVLAENRCEEGVLPSLLSRKSSMKVSVVLLEV